MQRVSGSYQSKARSLRPQAPAVLKQKKPSPVPIPTSQSRQNRLQNLTTQLLWRLQQSSPYHSSSSADLVLPALPEASPKSGAPARPGRLLPGLEESRGALYEIGVSDDGTFVGLTADEMEESLTNLRAMAASLGCKVSVLRTVIVGDCEWVENTDAKKTRLPKLRKEQLWVTEALVLPDLDPRRRHTTGILAGVDPLHADPISHEDCGLPTEDTESQTEQLRVSLTGSTTSGKSSLLGTLSTSTLDNGRGKSRLSLLKHRHEIVSGVTSSVAPELIGYRNAAMVEGTTRADTDVINYASGNVSSWNDIHSAAEDGRLVFVTDSAGHPRYRRTIIRNLVSWAPHWTVCCVAADDDEDNGGKIGATATAEEIFGSAGAGVDLSKAHLELCLHLGLSLVVVITKLDLASKSGLRQTLAKVLSTLKAAGRQPIMLSTTSRERLGSHSQSLACSEEDEVRRMLASMGEDVSLVVPIVLTSAVSGTGIGKLHALLRHLPIPPPVQQPMSPEVVSGPSRASPSVLFHIDEIFDLSNTGMGLLQNINSQNADQLLILSGHMKYGELSVGDELHVGPVTPDTSIELTESKNLAGAGTFAGARAKPPPEDSTVLPLQSSSNGSSPPESRHWQLVRVLSLRNLRLPVRRLVAGQVGTISITSVASVGSRRPGWAAASTANLKLRKGMILADFGRPSDVDATPAAHKGFTAIFTHCHPATLVSGALAIVYIASIRASVKVLSVDASEHGDAAAPSDVGDVFDFDDNGVVDDGGVGLSSSPPDSVQLEASFQFVQYHEWVELGTQVLVMPGGSGVAGASERGEKSSVGLEGLVGRITDVVV